MQGLGGVYLAGAWCGYGFHEDGLKSAIAVAEALGATIPWTPRTVSPKIGIADQLAMAAFDRFAKASITTGRLRFVLPNGEELAYGSPDSSQAAVAPGVRTAFDLSLLRNRDKLMQTYSSGCDRYLVQQDLQRRRESG